MENQFDLIHGGRTNLSCIQVAGMLPRFCLTVAYQNKHTQVYTDYVPVRVEAGRGGEALVADVAYVRLLPRVGPRVPLQEARPVETLPAHLKRDSYYDCTYVRIWQICHKLVTTGLDCHLRGLY